MKKLATMLLLFLMAFGTTLYADYPSYNYSDSCEVQTCYDPCDPCAPCAPTCGTGCGISWSRIGVGIGIVAAIIAGVAGGNDHCVHSHN